MQLMFSRVIPSLGELLKLSEYVTRFNFVPTITGGHLCSDNDRILLSLPVRFGGLAIPLFHNDRNTNMKTLENQHRQ